MRANSVLETEATTPGLHQAAAWRDAVAPFWDFSIRKEDLPEFRGQSRVRHLGNAIVCCASASGLRFERKRALVARMGVDHILAHVRISGRSRFEIDARERACGPGDIGLFDLSRPLAARSTDYQALTVVLPRRLFGANQNDLDALHGAIIRGGTPFGLMLTGHLRSLSVHAAGFTAAEALAAAEATALLLGAAIQGLSGADRIAQGADRAPLLIAIRRFIESDLASPDLTAESLCGRFGVSRSALYRLFAPLGGVAGYLRQRRLDCAYRDLATSGDCRSARISEVAYRWQFDSPAHFAQAFRTRYGCAPRDVRAQAQVQAQVQAQAQAVAGAAGAAAADPALRRDGWADFYDWVLRLAA